MPPDRVWRSMSSVLRSARRTTCSATSTARGSNAPRSPTTRRGGARSTSSPSRPRKTSTRSSKSRRTPSPAPRRARSATSTRASWTPSASPRSAARRSSTSSRASTPSTASRRSSAPSASSSATASPGSSHLYIEPDPGNPQRYVPFFIQGGLSLPDESYYRLENFEATRTAFRAHVQKMLELAGVADAAASADRIVALETELATHHWDNVKSRDAVATYNLKSWDEVQALAGVDLRPVARGHRARAPRRVRRGERLPAELRRGPRLAARRGAARGLEGVAALLDRPRERAVPLRRVRRRELRVLRHAAHRRAGQPRALEARRRPRRGGAGRGDRPRLRRAALPADARRWRWTSSSRTSSRPTASRSPSSSG